MFSPSRTRESTGRHQGETGEVISPPPRRSLTARSLPAANTICKHPPRLGAGGCRLRCGGSSPLRVLRFCPVSLSFAPVVSPAAVLLLCGATEDRQIRFGTFRRSTVCHKKSDHTPIRVVYDKTIGGGATPRGKPLLSCGSARFRREATPPRWVFLCRKRRFSQKFHLFLLRIHNLSGKCTKFVAFAQKPAYNKLWRISSLFFFLQHTSVQPLPPDAVKT